MVEFASRYSKPTLHIHSGQSDAAQSLRDFVSGNEILTLNVVGPHESKEPDLGKFTRGLFEAAFET